MRRACIRAAGFSHAMSVLICTRGGFGRAGVSFMQIGASVRGWRTSLARSQETKRLGG